MNEMGKLHDLQLCHYSMLGWEGGLKVDLVVESRTILPDHDRSKGRQRGRALNNTV